MPKTAIQDRLKTSILILDGAMGTMLQNADLTAEDFGGEEYEGCNEYLNVTALTCLKKSTAITWKQVRILLRPTRLEQRALFSQIMICSIWLKS